MRAQETLVRDALERVREAARPGSPGASSTGWPATSSRRPAIATQRTGPGEDPNDGFQFSLGHGVGLEIHEEPGLGRLGRSPLVAGDVVAIEPGLWEREVGGVRFEDLLLITEDGAETLTDYPYDLTPRA